MDGASLAGLLGRRSSSLVAPRICIQFPYQKASPFLRLTAFPLSIRFEGMLGLHLIEMMSTSAGLSSTVKATLCLARSRHR
jgi:hypothetical protein